MKKFTRALPKVLLLILFLNSSAQANSMLSNARIDSNTGNRLIVSFNAPVSIKDASGFRLVGGVSRIERLLSGNGTNQLVFKLTRRALPDDRFKFLYWSEMGNARHGSKMMDGIAPTAVSNQVKSYKGEGRLYYVSTSGKDSNDGRSTARPFRTIDRAQSASKAGDYILLKRGDVFKNTYITAKKSGKADQYITFATYGSGNKPVIEHNNVNTFTIADRDYVHVDNLHFKVYGSGETGVYITGSSRYPVVSNCRVEGFGKPHYGVNYGINDGASKVVVAPKVLNNHITGFRWNIRSSGYPYNGTHEVKGGLIENNLCTHNRAVSDGDGISAQRGKYHGLIIRKNEIHNYYDDGIDLYSADNVIAEYNTIHSPQQPSTSGQGIKAGGITRTEVVNGHQSTNIIVRYNKVYNLYNRVSDLGSQHGIQTNSGSTGKVYGNLVYDVQGHGIVVSGPIKNWEVHHNTVINAGEDALQLYTEGTYATNVAIKNNILKGKGSDIRVIARGSSKKAVGNNNILLGKGVKGAYSSQSDVKLSMEELFVNPGKDDYRLKKNSPAINKGVRIEGFRKGINGRQVVTKPDLGAHQYTDGTVSTTPPAPTPSPEPTPDPSADDDNGLRYRHYHGSWKRLPDFGPMKAVKTGVVGNFTLAPSTKKDFFGFLYQGYIKIEKAGKYTFFTSSDDGSKLWIDGKTIVDNDGIHGTQERLGTVYLSKGFHEIEASFFDGAYAEAFKVSYQGPGIAKQTIPNKMLFLERPAGEPKPAPSPEPTPDPSADDDNGLRYRHYHGSWKRLPDFGPMKAVKTGVVGNFTLAPSTKKDFFGFLYQGYIKIEKAGKYTFFTSSDDGSKLWIDGKTIVDNDGIHGTQERLGTVYLSKGFHEIEASFFDGAYAEAFKVSYQGPGIAKQTIPNKMLFLERPAGEPKPAPSPAPAPVADSKASAHAGSDKQVSSNVDQVILRGWGTGPNAFRKYYWEKISGPKVRIEDQRTANVDLYDLREGVYKFRFTVTDSKGNQAYDDMILTVKGDQANLLGARTSQTSSFGSSSHTLVESNSILVFPNPVKDVINVRVDSEDANLPFSLFDQYGHLIHQGTINTGLQDSKIDLIKIGKKFEAGIYVLKVYSQLHGVQSFRLLKD